MTTAILVLVAAVAIIAFVVLAIRYERYRANFKFTDDDVDSARRDSLARSHSTVSGKVQEHLAPLFPEFCAEFNPRDARFLGSPVDFVVFDGLDAGEVDRIVFVEVKTGRSSLSARERLVRNAVEAGRIEWRLLLLVGEGDQLAG